MCAVSRSRLLNVCRDPPISAYTHIGHHIILISMFTTLVVEVTAKESAGIIGKYRIYANNIATIRIFAGEVTVNVIISQRLKFAVRTFGASIPLFVAKFPVPFPTAYRLIAAFASCGTEPPSGEYILTPLKQVAEQSDLLFQRKFRLLRGRRLRFVRGNTMKSKECP